VSSSWPGTLADVRLRDGLSLRVGELGTGPPLLLVHGFTGAHVAWPELVVNGLGRSFRVIAPDLVGHGKSSRCAAPERFALDEVLRDLEQVLEARGAPRAHWIGYSMGGRITLGACARMPERVASAVLEGSSPGLRDPVERKARREADAALATRLCARGIEEFVDYWTELPLFESQRELAAGVRSRQRAQRLANDPASLAACLQGLGTGTQPSFWDALRGLSMPLLLVHGARDAKFRGLAERMLESLPNAQIASIAGAGHTTHLERPEAFLEAVLRFHADPR